ncbi:esterase/lipase family protein [Patescibacteria group bacterium]
MPDLTERKTGKGRPVIIAKGFFPIPLPTAQIAGAYEKQGFRPVVIPLSLKDKLDVVTYADTVAATIRREARSYGGQVDVVGTSMGGVALYYAIKLLDVASLVRTAVAAGAPFHGTLYTVPGLAVPVLGRSARQMAPHSAFLRRLRELPLPPGPKYISICGTRDWISPWPTTYVEGALNPHWGFKHADLMTFGRTHRRIALMLLEE